MPVSVNASRVAWLTRLAARAAKSSSAMRRQSVANDNSERMSIFSDTGLPASRFVQFLGSASVRKSCSDLPDRYDSVRVDVSDVISSFCSLSAKAR